jgi:hypothetical protein
MVSSFLSGNGGSGSSFVTSSRARRKQLLIERKSKARGAGGEVTIDATANSTGGSHPDVEEYTVVTIGGGATACIVLLIVGLGAAIATCFFWIFQPDCFKDLSSSSSSS